MINKLNFWVACILSIGIFFIFAYIFLSSQKINLSFDKYKAILCQSSIKWEVPTELIRLVILAENTNNIDWKDNAQNILFKLLLDNKSDIWWSQWANNSKVIAEAAKEPYLLSNKWPNELIMSGYVMSIGSAQITPSTALAACRWAKMSFFGCLYSEKAIVKNLLDLESAIYLTGMVLAYERDIHKSANSIDVNNNYPLWATIYNVGGNYYRNSGKFDKIKINNFGKWVEQHYKTLEEYKCKE